MHVCAINEKLKYPTKVKYNNYLPEAVPPFKDISLPYSSTCATPTDPQNIIRVILASFVNKIQWDGKENERIIIIVIQYAKIVFKKLQEVFHIHALNLLENQWKH